MHYPNELLETISWAFNDIEITNLQDFNKELISYNRFLEKEIDPTEIVMRIKMIIVQYYYGDNFEDLSIEENSDNANYEQSKMDFEIVSDNGEYFSCGELLFKIHMKVAPLISNHDHKFFEGLMLSQNDSTVLQAPVYILQLGS